MLDKQNEQKFQYTSDAKIDDRTAFGNKDRISELILAAQNGDQKAFGELLSVYEPLINATVAKFRLSNMSDADEEDLRQEAVLAFYSALVSYDPGISGVEFGLYAKICICNKLVSQTRIIKRHMDHSVVSYDANELLEHISEYEDPAARIVELENERSLMKLINDNLSKYEQKIVRLFVSGMSAAEMAEKLSSTEKSVNNAIYRIRTKLKKILKK